MDPSVITTLKAANEVSGLLATMAKLKDKLLANPSSAAEKLAYALNEVGKTFQVVETELVRFLVLGASPEALKNAMNSGDNPLYELEGPKLRSRVAEGRGSCFLIGSVYDQFLDKWLSRVLSPDEHVEMTKVFDRLREADDDLFAGLASVSDYLERQAKATLDEASKGDFQAAHRRLGNARAELSELRSAIGRAMVELYTLKNSFIVMSGSVVA